MNQKIKSVIVIVPVIGRQQFNVLDECKFYIQTESVKAFVHEIKIDGDIVFVKFQRSQNYEIISYHGLPFIVIGDSDD